MRRPGTRGFTLLEVLVAIAIFALVAIPLLRTQTQAAAALETVRRNREALAIAAERLDEVQAAATAPVGTTVIGGYDVSVRQDRITQAGFPVMRIGVVVRYRGTPYAELAAYRLADGQ